MTLRDDLEALSGLTRAAIGELHARRLDLMRERLQDALAILDHVLARQPTHITFEQAGCALEVETGRTIDLDTMERVSAQGGQE